MCFRVAGGVASEEAKIASPELDALQRPRPPATVQSSMSATAAPPSDGRGPASEWLTLLNNSFCDVRSDCCFLGFLVSIDFRVYEWQCSNHRDAPASRGSATNCARRSRLAQTPRHTGVSAPVVADPFPLGLACGARQLHRRPRRRWSWRDRRRWSWRDRRRRRSPANAAGRTPR